MSKLVPPHGGKGLVCALLEGKALEDEIKKAEGLKKVEISSRAKGDLIMMGIGGFSPLDGFMDKANWKSVCEQMLLTDGTFWPVPVTLDISAVPMLKHMSHLPVVIDPSHAAGINWMVEPLAKAAVAAGADGLMIEVHNDPARAKCDGAQSLTCPQFDALMQDITREAAFFGKEVN